MKGWQVLSLSSAGTTNLRQVKEVITCISLCTLTDSLSALLHGKAAFLPHPCCPLCSWWHRRPASPDLQNSFRALIVILYCRVVAESLKGTQPGHNFVRKTRQTLCVPALQMPLGYPGIICQIKASMAGLRSPSCAKVMASHDFVAIAAGHTWLPWTLQQLAQNPLPGSWTHKPCSYGSTRKEMRISSSIPACSTTHRWTVGDSLPWRIHGTWPFHYTLGGTAD